MATNVFPAIDIRPQQQAQPQPVDPLTQMSKIMALRSGMLQYQEQQLQLNSDLALMQAYHDSGGDFANTIQRAAASNAVLPSKMLALQQSYLDYQAKQSQKTKDDLANDETRGANLREVFDSVNNLPPDQRLAAANQKLQDVRSDPNRALTYGITDDSKIPAAFNSLDQLKTYETTLSGFEKATQTELSRQRALEIANRFGAIGPAQRATLNGGLADEYRAGFGLPTNASVPDYFQVQPTYDGSPATLNDYQRIRDQLHQTAMINALQNQRAVGNYLQGQQIMGQVAPETMTPGAGGQMPWLPPRPGQPQQPFAQQPSPQQPPQTQPPRQTLPQAPPQQTGPAGYAGGPAPQGSIPTPTAPQSRSGLPTGEDYIQTLPPIMQGQVRSVITGAIPFPSAVRGGGAELRARAVAADPTVNEQRYQLRQEYTKDASSGDINDINTALGHAYDLGQAIDALNNSNVPILNAIANKYSVQTGQTAVTTYNTIADKLSSEIAAAYIRGGGTGAERIGGAGHFDAKLGDQQLRDNLATTVQLLRSKINSKEYTWDQNFPAWLQAQYPEQNLQFQSRFLSFDAQRALNKWAPLSRPTPGGAGAGAAPPAGYTRIKASDGSLHDIPSGNLPKARQIDPNLQVVQ